MSSAAPLHAGNPIYLSWGVKCQVTVKPFQPQHTVPDCSLISARTASQGAGAKSVRFHSYFVNVDFTVLLKKISPNTKSPVKTNQNQGRVVVLSWPQQITRMPFLKWIFRLFIPCYSIFHYIHEGCNSKFKLGILNMPLWVIEASSV